MKQVTFGVYIEGDTNFSCDIATLKLERLIREHQILLHIDLD